MTKPYSRPIAGLASLVFAANLMVACASSAGSAAHMPVGAAPEEQTQVRDVVTNVTHHIDAKRWVELRGLFAEKVRTDYTSLFGGTPQEQSGDDLIGTWRKVLANVNTQHLLGPIVVHVDGATATAECHVRGLHRAPGAPGGELWEVLGHYLFELSRSANGAWSIHHMTLLTQAQTGNPKLLEQAQSK